MNFRSEFQRTDGLEPALPPRAADAPQTRRKHAQATSLTWGLSTAILGLLVIFLPGGSVKPRAPDPRSPQAHQHVFEDPAQVAKLIHADVFPIAGVHVPLPRGNWTVFSWLKPKNANVHELNYHLTRAHLVAPAPGGQIYAANRMLDASAKFIRDRNCRSETDDDIEYVVDSCDSDDLSYWVLKHKIATQWNSVSDPQSNIRGRGADGGTYVPVGGYRHSDDYLEAEFVRSTASFTIVARFSFTPETFVEARDFDAPDLPAPQAPAVPDRNVFANDFRNWGRAYWPRFKQAYAEAD